MPGKTRGKTSVDSSLSLSSYSRQGPRPVRFRTAFVALRNMPYSFGDGCVGECSCSGGVLRRGDTVWADESCDRKAERSAMAYLDGAGFILLDPACLVRADVLREVDG